MPESLASIPGLRRLADLSAGSSGDADDEAWLDRGMTRGQLHELLSDGDDDAAAAAGAAVALALAGAALPILWVRTEAAARRGGRLHGTGLVELGLDPAALLMAVVADEAALLRAAADGARCHGLGTLMVELWGRAPGYDLTATRRLMLAAEASGVTVLALRVAVVPMPSAAASRWRVAAAPSRALDADAPGPPAFSIECLRRRGGPAGRSWRVEWDRDLRSFREAPLPGAGVPLAAGRPAEERTRAPLRRTG